MSSNEVRDHSSVETKQLTDRQLYLLCGLQGTGKSTIGQLIAERIGAQILKTDKIRSELFPNPQYTPAERQAVYDEMFRRATEQILQGKRIILDATFLSQSRRAVALEIAQETGVGFKIIQAEANDEEIRNRLDARYGDDNSTAAYEVYLREKNEFE